MGNNVSKLRALTRNVRTSTTIALWVCVLSAIGLFVASFCIPPTGEIHPSILKAASILFAVISALIAREAIIEGMGVKLTYGNTTVEVRDQDGPDQPMKEHRRDEAGKH